jgi:threonine aldolase
MGGEAVVFFHPELAQDFLFRRKQSMQLASKMRFISAQLGALLTNDLWLTNAQHSNRMAKLLESEVRQIPGIELVYHVEANGVFAKIPHDAIARIQGVTSSMSGTKKNRWCAGCARSTRQKRTCGSSRSSSAR